MNYRIVPFGALLVAASVQAAGPAAPMPGPLTSQERQYLPQGCTHQGPNALCNFVLVNQGSLATLVADGPSSELRGLQFVDNGNVPHAVTSAYFVDRFGARQERLILQRGDQSTLVVEFGGVDPAVSSGFYLFNNQVLPGIEVAPTAARAGSPAPTPIPAPSAVAQPSQAVQQVQAAQAPLRLPPVALPAIAVPQLSTPIMQAAPTVYPQGCYAGNNASLCNVNQKAVAVQNKVNAAVGTVNATVQTANQTLTTVRQLRDMFSGLLPAKQEAPGPALSTPP